MKYFNKGNPCKHARGKVDALDGAVHTQPVVLKR